MKQKIQRTISAILCITLLISMVSFTTVIYYKNFEVMKKDIAREALYISEGYNVGGDEFLEIIQNQGSDSRITLIQADGTVIMDSQGDEKYMENHLSREEVRLANRIGVGDSTRHSDTLGSHTYYYAIKLGDGSIIRVSRTTHSVLNTVIELIPSFIVVGIILLLFAIYISKKATEKLIDPINKIDVENPLEQEIYKELNPLIQRIDKSNKTKEEAENLRKEFSANVSHELKTPLTSISGYAELMKSGMVKVDDIPGFAEKIYFEASRMTVLIQDILRISHLDEKGFEMEKEEVDIYYLVREICSRLSYQSEAHDIQVVLTGSSVKIFGVRAVLDEMLFNICENAIKYNKPSKRVDIWVGNTLDATKVIVEDQGVGIPKEEQERVFERFYRVDKSHSKDTGGTGLGLSIVKHAARLHDGKIKLESEVGRGTKISLEFPKI